MFYSLIPKFSRKIKGNFEYISPTCVPLMSHGRYLKGGRRDVFVPSNGYRKGAKWIKDG